MVCRSRWLTLSSAMSDRHINEEGLDEAIVSLSSLCARAWVGVEERRRGSGAPRYRGIGLWSIDCGWATTCDCVLGLPSIQTSYSVAVRVLGLPESLGLMLCLIKISWDVRNRTLNVPPS